MRSTANGRLYLNIGCGSHFSPEWTNLDLRAQPGVTAHDVRQALPYPAETFDAAYSSHVLEHLTRVEGEFFLREQYRVLKKGGVCRVVVPDLERICRDYLEQLARARRDPTAEHRLDYEWGVLQLLDQMVREGCGGEMFRMIKQRRFNPDFLRSRFGDELCSLADQLARDSVNRNDSFLKTALLGLKKRARQLGFFRRTAANQGELHRWMYDSFNLEAVLTRVGFVDFRAVNHLESRIPDWPSFRLDLAQNGEGPRKPDSLFAEVVKPGQV